MPPISAHEDIGALWLSTLQRAIGRASHDVKDALNGVSVNLEVIRSRAARPDVAASAVAKFGDAAAQQLDRLTALSDAILGLARAERHQPDVQQTLRRVVAVCAASASSRDAAITLAESPSVGSTATSITGDVLRLAVTSILLELAAGTDPAVRAPDVSCHLAGSAEALEVIISTSGRQPSMPSHIADVVRAAGVQWAESAGRISLFFPRA